MCALIYSKYFMNLPPVRGQEWAVSENVKVVGFIQATEFKKLQITSL